MHVSLFSFLLSSSDGRVPMTNHGNNDNENNGTFAEAIACSADVRRSVHIWPNQENHTYWRLYLDCDRVWVGKCCCPEQGQNQTRELIITKVPVTAKFASVTLMHPSIKSQTRYFEIWFEISDLGFHVTALVRVAALRD
ncbi:hypothetical protein BC826DRAFT_185146 [Russula brevipes]|nr:hypothetical protein BC826DRAFT_185146 [Russula brevipes]